ncbi:hypothetical protein QTP88_019018 [Uroleucon formosanum]
MENTKKIFSIFSFEKRSKTDKPQEMNCEVLDDSVIEIVEKDDIIVNRTVTNFIETLPFQHNKNKLQHSNLGNLATGPYRPVLNLNEKLKKHVKTKRHLVSVTKMSGYLTCKKSGSVMVKQCSGYKEQLA